MDIVGRPSVTAPVISAALIDLSQSAFDKSGGASEKGGKPHPEYRARAAKTDRGGDPRDISCAYAGGGGDHQRLERRKAVFIVFRFHDNADGFPEHAELYEPRADGEIYARAKQQDDQNIGVEQIAQ